MKKANNILGIITFIALMPLTWIAYKIKDAIDKREREKPTYYVRKDSIDTVYPEGWEDTKEGFDNWSKNLYKQLNKN